MSILIIRAELVNPPTLTSSLRSVTLYSSARLKMDIYLELNKEDKEFTDLYYHWAKQRGLFDFIHEIIYYGDIVEAIRIDSMRRSYNTIVTDRIVPENTWNILNQISSYH